MKFIAGICRDEFLQVVIEKVVVFIVVLQRFCPAVLLCCFRRFYLFVVKLLIHHDVALFRDE